MSTDKTYSRLAVRNVSDETQKLLKLHATYRGLQLGEMLEIIVNEWHQQHPYPCTPRYSTVADASASANDTTE